MWASEGDWKVCSRNAEAEAEAEAEEEASQNAARQPDEDASGTNHSELSAQIGCVPQ